MSFAKKLIAAILCVTAIVSLVPMTVSAAFEGSSHSVIGDDFDGSPKRDDYSDSISGMSPEGISSGSEVKVTDKGAISGSSLFMKKAELWWKVNNFGPYMEVSFDVKASSESTELKVGVTTDAISDASGAGKLFSLKSSGGSITVLDNTGKSLKTLSDGKSHKVAAKLERNSSAYTIYADGTAIGSAKLSSDVKYVRKLYLTNSAGEIAIDNLTFRLISFSTPQQNSLQEANSSLIPEVKIISNKKYNEILVYVNKTELEARGKEIDGKIYVSFEETAKALGYTCVFGERSYKITKGDTVLKDYTEGFVDGYVTPEYINRVFGVKVWYDEATKTVVFSDDEYANDEILRAFNGKLYMNGEPYYEISFNKFDLMWQYWSDLKGEYDAETPDSSWGAPAAEKSLKILSEYGFKSIRVFWNGGSYQHRHEDASVDELLDVMSDLLDMCDKYGIKVVVCLNTMDRTFCPYEYIDGNRELGYGYGSDYFVANMDDDSRETLTKFITKLVTRFKDRKTILMWEVQNEVDLDADVGAATSSVKYSALQAAEFIDFIAGVVKAADSEHLVSSGNALTRQSHYNLLKAVLNGTGTDWTVDSIFERRTIYDILSNNCDVISMHPYDVGTESAVVISDAMGNLSHATAKNLMTDAAAIGKPLYVGELNYGDLRANINNPDVYLKNLKTHLDELIDAGVQLTHWWSFDSARACFYEEDTLLNIRPETKLGVSALEVFRDANAKMIEKNRVNAMPDANAHTSSDALVVTGVDYEVTDNYPDPVDPDVPKSPSLALLIGVPVGAAVVIAAVVVVIIVKKKKKA